MLGRISGELSEVIQKLASLLKEQEKSKLTLPDMSNASSFDELDRELFLMLVKRIEVKETGEVKIMYNFKV